VARKVHTHLCCSPVVANLVLTISCIQKAIKCSACIQVIGLHISKTLLRYCIYAIRVVSIVLQVQFVGSWMFPQAMNFIVISLLYDQYDRLSKEFSKCIGDRGDRLKACPHVESNKSYDSFNKSKEIDHVQFSATSWTTEQQVYSCRLSNATSRTHGQQIACCFDKLLV